MTMSCRCRHDKMRNPIRRKEYACRCRFQLDCKQVYWNSQLEFEHERIKLYIVHILSRKERPTNVQCGQTRKNQGSHPSLGWGLKYQHVASTLKPFWLLLVNLKFFCLVSILLPPMNRVCNGENQTHFGYLLAFNLMLIYFTLFKIMTAALHNCLAIVNEFPFETNLF